MAAFGKILAYNWIAWTLVRFYPHAPIRATPQWRHMHMHMHMYMCMHMHMHMCMHMHMHMSCDTRVSCPGLGT